ncbi:DUF4097 family beta strand repeat-containing protein [Actinomycetospora straminea]|uniref:DUF4097 family beta strand repeat-containing protein n=1 Tax=Actinomycetospora straminea TaxID=663607 RepID=A0ABP9F4V0_9PSEU|nr:hypothetical protein [Actinomycetospora straminea]MDD7931649.1 hypothetical protein [Actinomycetospora straminea]
MSAPAREVTGAGTEPVTLDVALDAGTVRVHLDPQPAGEDTVRLRVEADPDAPPGWMRGLSGLLGFLGVDRSPTTPEERAAAAVAATTLDWDAGARRLVVRGPQDWALRGVPLAVTVRAPRDSGLRLRAGAARVVVEGRADEVSVHGTGEVRLDEVAGRVDLRCGAGEVRIARLAGPLRMTGGAGGVRIEHVLAPAEITTGAGRVRLGDVHADVAVRAAAGDVRVADALAGDLELGTGVGSLWVGVHPGVDAQVELHATVGRVRSDLPVRDERPASDTADAGRSDAPAGAPLRVRARTGAGDVTVATARPRPALTAPS